MNRYLKEKEEKHDVFFGRLIQQFGMKKTRCEVTAVLHVLPDVMPFYRALDQVFNVVRIIPKPRSVNEAARKRLPQGLIADVRRDDLHKYPNVRRLLLRDLKRAPKSDFLLLDIGGYFSRSGNKLKEEFGRHFRGIVEDTENGLQKYAEIASLAYPLFQVARSPLKDNEDYMVGRAIAFSAESLLRSLCILVNGARVGVIGYGKVGKSISEALRLKQGNISVFDRDSVRLTHAYSRGFAVKSKQNILADSEILCLATGNRSLLRDEFKTLRPGAFVFSVTSSDDEVDLSWVRENYEVEHVSEFVDRYHRRQHHFYLLNQGNAINFVHGTTVGDFILLVHAEILVSAYMLATQRHPSGIHETGSTARSEICNIWLSQFSS